MLRLERVGGREVTEEELITIVKALPLLRVNTVCDLICSIDCIDRLIVLIMIVLISIKSNCESPPPAQGKR